MLQVLQQADELFARVQLLILQSNLTMKTM
jgi:hypothetical protein